MPRSAELLLQAVERYGSTSGEDRLTEIFATVLRTDCELAAWYCEKAGVPCRSAGEIRTQVWLGPDAGRVDMQMIVWDRRGRTRRIWSEHKTESSESSLGSEQLERYANATGDPGLAIVEDPHTAVEDPSARWKTVTWTEVAHEAHRVGRGLGGRSWRERATTKDASARERVLLEFIDYLERHHRVPDLSRVDHLDVIAYGRGAHARAKVENLFDLACDELRSASFATGSERPGHESKTLPRFVVYEPVPDGWHPPGGPRPKAEFRVDGADDWKPDPLYEPAFSAGLSFYREPRSPIAKPPALDDPEWRSELERCGITYGVTNHGYVGRLVKTLYLSELMNVGGLDEQASAVASWARNGIEDILGREPRAAT